MNSVKFNNANIYPSKVVCIGRNYVEHILELQNDIPKEVVIFNKPNSAITQHIFIDGHQSRHYEAEISFLISNQSIVGVGFGIDITKRALQSELKENQLPWEKAKAFDHSAVFSDFIEFDGSCDGISMELFINGKLKQTGSYDQMIHKPVKILKEIQEFMTLEDNDIVMTGTPKGVGEIQLNDHFVGKLYYNNKQILASSWVVKNTINKI